MPERPEGVSAEEEHRIVAAVDMVGRMGGQEFQLRFSDDEEPVIWMACARVLNRWQATGAMTPWRAIFRLLEELIDGGTCTHCRKPTAVDELPASDLITATEDMVCWYRYDPELRTFRRQCEGVS